MEVINVRRLKVLQNRTVFRAIYVSMPPNLRERDEIKIVLTSIIQNAGKWVGMTGVLSISLKISSWTNTFITFKATFSEALLIFFYSCSFDFQPAQIFCTFHNTNVQFTNENSALTHYPLCSIAGIEIPAGCSYSCWDCSFWISAALTWELHFKQ